LRTKLIVTMKSLKRILCCVMRLNELLYLLDAGRLLQRRKNGCYYCSSERSHTKMGCCIRIPSRSLRRRQSYSIWRFAMFRARLLFVWWRTS
jgi:hypothetical protein